MITVINPPQAHEFNTGHLQSLQNVAAELGIVGAVSVRFGSADESRRLNAGFRGKDYSTDVLTFPMNEEIDGVLYAGDIFICLDVARAQANEFGNPLSDEIFLLMVHGLLHLAGYDHETDRGEMLSLQSRILSQYAVNDRFAASPGPENPADRK